jgi:hypothetical protein
VEWKEGPEYVTAVYNVEASTERCSYLMVKGEGPVWQPDGRRVSIVEWSVSGPEDIKDMLPPLQTAMGILHRPKGEPTQSSYTDLYVSVFDSADILKVEIFLCDRHFSSPES